MATFTSLRLDDETRARLAPVSGIDEPPCACAPIPILEFHESADSALPFDGGHILVLGNFLSAVAVVDEWARVNGCSGAPVLEQVTPHVRRDLPHCEAATVGATTARMAVW